MRYSKNKLTKQPTNQTKPPKRPKEQKVGTKKRAESYKSTCIEGPKERLVQM